ncbi:hypothetical protein V8E36_008267 [Tilletia maclaganii]
MPLRLSTLTSGFLLLIRGYLGPSLRSLTWLFLPPQTNSFLTRYFIMLVCPLLSLPHYPPATAPDSRSGSGQWKYVDLADN